APVNSYPMAVSTSLFNPTGQPAISIPTHHHHATGPPAGVQIIAAPRREDLLPQTSHTLELPHPWTPPPPAQLDSQRQFQATRPPPACPSALPARTRSTTPSLGPPGSGMTTNTGTGVRSIRDPVPAAAGGPPRRWLAAAVLMVGALMDLI